ncbi:helix-turn-helix transcriptional regulator [Phormidium sp. FACHB-592]|uniref:AraC family transcriptional regulator n=1 Tax=Stenomitos frigidus AS-A4 TaxID=2933935 RepID=A0ABV0KS14_9CYAN|nr:AraC family transcriptional regulator [Phormidium sp. FACHB-592]MBD2074613.1 helix-turn-helix transcriptional regulator [Phormidium sp. FACHB-592]
MPDSQIHLIDTATAQTFPAAPSGTVLSSSTALGWRGLTVELHQLPPVEYPEHYVQGHRLAVVHRGKPITYEWKEGGRWKTTQTYPGIFFLQSAGETNAPRWFEPFETVAIALDPSFVAQSFRDTIKPDRIRLQERRAEFDPIIAQFARQFEAELTSGRYGGALYGESLALAFSLYLLEQHSDSSQSLPRPRGKFSSLQLREMIEYIHVYLSEELSLTALANHLNLSAFHFARLFKNSLGLSPHQYVLQNRVERAKKLIAVSTKVNLTDIALQAGFYDQPHFDKAFKRFVGVPPKIFAKQKAS